jgi:polysaccharide export outer membrane protein
MYFIDPLSSLSRSVSRLLVPATVSFAALVALSGCALAPGMYVGTSMQKTGDDSAAPDAPPPGRLTPITATLINQQRASRNVDISPEVKKLFGQPKPYVIGAGDVLNIVVWDHPELAIAPAGGLATDAASLAPVGNGFNVSKDGSVQFPYVGALKLSGLTEDEARDLFTRQLAKFIKDPQVTVRLQSYRSGRVYLDGEFRLPGLQPLNDIPMTLPEAIGRAGGFAATADRSSIFITRNGSTVNVNLPLFTARGVNPGNILLTNGDLVNVRSLDESKVYVLGEVQRPASQNLRNGRLSLNQALGEAGGVNQGSGDPRQIFVIRAANTLEPEIYHLDGRSPAAYAMAEGFELNARDVVYVDPVPLVRWNRVISLILPSAQAVTTTRSVSNAVNY